MPYDEDLEERIERIVSRWPKTVSKKMFGGICHLINGNMLGGVYHTYLILRLGEEGAWEALKQLSSRPFDITGKPMKGWVMIEGKGVAGDKELQAWLKKARKFVETLPAK
jgi:TfoX/Sxy family transcriptional regulator of competence genes